MTRVGLLPSWWQEPQPCDLTLASHIAWLRMLVAIPLPFGPVPGNRLLSGIFIIEYHHCAG